MSNARVFAVHAAKTHSFNKETRRAIRFIAGIGVEDDAHAGMTVQHLSRIKRDPNAPNLRQVHLIHHELLVELNQRGFDVSPGAMGENITTAGIDLLALPQDALLRIGPDAVLQITGLRNPCSQLDRYRPGLLAAVLDRDERGALIRKCGIMGIVVSGGTAATGDSIVIELPEVSVPLEPV